MTYQSFDAFAARYHVKDNFNHPRYLVSINIEVEKNEYYILEKIIKLSKSKIRGNFYKIRQDEARIQEDSRKEKFEKEK